MFAQDIQLTDKALWQQFQTTYASGNYAEALEILKNPQLRNKGLTADVLNALTDYVVHIQNTTDPDFKADRIPCQVSQPTGQSIGQVWFEVTGQG